MHIQQVGNWLEDVHLEEEKQLRFIQSQADGQLVMSQMGAKNKLYNRPVTLSTCADGHLRFGSVVMLAHQDTETVACVDLTENVFESDLAGRLVTASKCRQPVARNTFKIIPVEAGVEDGDALHYGEPFYLACDKSLAEGSPPYLLASALKSCFNASRIANQQPVSARLGKTTAAVWTCEKIATNTGIARHLSVHEPVPASHPVVVQHRITKQALAADPKYADFTDFGRELEVTCHNHFGKAKVEALSAEIAGRATPATMARLENSPNYWKFLVAESET